MGAGEGSAGAGGGAGGRAGSSVTVAATVGGLTGFENSFLKTPNMNCAWGLWTHYHSPTRLVDANLSARRVPSIMYRQKKD
jgi:hypothetical protein